MQNLAPKKSTATHEHEKVGPLLNFLCWVCHWERWEQQWKEHINFGLFHHGFLGNMGWKGVLGNHLKAMFWQTLVQDLVFGIGNFFGNDT
jgi:hypothetical protein